MNKIRRTIKRRLVLKRRAKRKSVQKKINQLKLERNKALKQIKESARLAKAREETIQAIQKKDKTLGIKPPSKKSKKSIITSLKETMKKLEKL